MDELAYRIESRLTNQVSFVKEKVAGLLRHLEALSPLGILQRGYSITFSFPERAVVKSFRDVSPGDKIETRLAEGKVVSKVLELEK